MTTHSIATPLFFVDSALPDTDGTNWTPVAGATGKTYQLPAGAATGAQYQATVSYTDSRGNSESSKSDTVTVVAPTASGNQAPSLTGDGAFPATTSLFSNVAVTTVESGQTLQTLTLTVSGLQNDAAEKLTIDGALIGLSAAITTSITGGTLGGVHYAIAMTGSSPDTATITLTHAGLTPAQTKALIESLALSGGSTADLRVVTLESLQDSGGADTGLIGLSTTVDVGSTLTGSNTAPTVSGDLGATVVEDAVVPLTLTDLNGTDTEQPNGLKVVLTSTPNNGTLFRDVNGNGKVDTGETLGATSKFALADVTAGTTTTANVGYSVTVTVSTAIVTLTKTDTGTACNGLLDDLKYANASTNPTNGNRSITLTSVTETGDEKSDVAITSYVGVTTVNTAPALTLAPITVLEGGSKTLTTSDIAATDPDTPLTSLTYTLASAPTQGWVYIDANGNGVRDTDEALCQQRHLHPRPAHLWQSALPARRW